MLQALAGPPFIGGQRGQHPIGLRRHVPADEIGDAQQLLVLWGH